MPESITVLVGARARTLDAARPEADALAFRGETLVAVGSREGVLAAAGDAAQVIDVGGAVVCPGFVDAHHHAGIAALYGGTVDLSAPRVRDLAGLRAALAAASADLPPGRWLVASGWDEAQLAERRPPTREELDEAVPDRPLFALHYTCHRGLANGAALALAGIERSTPDPSGGQISRGRGGHPDGLLIERAMSGVEAMARRDRVVRDVDGFVERLDRHYRAIVAAGITRVADTAVPLDLIPLYRQAARRGAIRIPTLLFPTSMTGWLEAPWDVLEGPRTGERDVGNLRIGPVKLVFDGAPGCAMCLRWGQAFGVMARTVGLAVATGTLDPVRTSLSTVPRYGADVRTGIALYRPDEARGVVAALAERGFGVASHAIGNAAAALALDAYDAAGPALHGAWTPRIEHGSYLDEALVRRIADGGYGVAAQPAMIAMHAYASAPSIPGLPLKPLRWLLDAGVTVAGSSDYPVTTFDPLAGIRAAHRRENARGVVVDPAQRIELDEALALYTRNAAALTGALDEAGTLEAGKRADLVVLDGELGAPDARVRATVVGGEVRHGGLA